MVDNADPTKLYKSTDKGDNWALITTRDHLIQSAWHDRTNGIIWFVDCDNPGSDFDVWYIDLSDDSITPIATSSGADADSVYVIDIFIIGSDVLVMNWEERSGTNTLIVWDVDTDPFVEKDTIIFAVTYVSHMWGVVHSHFVNDHYLTIIGEDNSGTKEALVVRYEHTAPILALGNTNTGWEVPTNKSARGMAYDDVNDIFMVLKKNSDQLNYLVKINLEV